jgi:hypothetical protein
MTQLLHVAVSFHKKQNLLVTQQHAGPGVAPGWSAAKRTYHLLLETVSAASIMLTIFYWMSDSLVTIGYVTHNT